MSELRYRCNEGPLCCLCGRLQHRAEDLALLKWPTPTQLQRVKALEWWAQDEEPALLFPYLVNPISVGYLQVSNCRKVLTAFKEYLKTNPCLLPFLGK